MTLLPYLRLHPTEPGCWIERSSKMVHEAQFRPHQLLVEGRQTEAASQQTSVHRGSAPLAACHQAQRQQHQRVGGGFGDRAGLDAGDLACLGIE
jgi:hypothetical protein